MTILSNTVFFTDIHLFFVIPFISFGLTLTRIIIKPLKELESQIKEIAEGKMNPIQIKSSDKEIKSLVETFNKMFHELQIKQKQLIQAEKLSSLGTLLSGIAHELNNPLSNISTSCQILIEEIEEADTKYKKKNFFRQLNHKQKGQKKYYQNNTRFLKKKGTEKKETISVRNLIDETIILIKGEIPTKINLSIEVENNLLIYADKQRIQQALLNLIKNAIQASGSEAEVKIKAYSYRDEIFDRYLSLKKMKVNAWEGSHAIKNLFLLKLKILDRVSLLKFYQKYLNLFLLRRKVKVQA